MRRANKRISSKNMSALLVQSEGSGCRFDVEVEAAVLLTTSFD